MMHPSMVDELPKSRRFGKSRCSHPKVLAMQREANEHARSLLGTGAGLGSYDGAWIDEWQHLEPIWAMAPHHEFMRRLFWHLGYLWAWMALWWALLAGTSMGNAYAQIAAAGTVAFCYGTCGMIAWRMTRAWQARQAHMDQGTTLRLFDAQRYWNPPVTGGYFAPADTWKYTQDWQEQEER